MCSIESPSVVADESQQATVPTSAFGAADYCALLSKLKSTIAYAGGRNARRRRDYLKKYAASERGKEVIRSYEQRNRAKRCAYNRMRHALLMGDLVRPDLCETCGAVGRTEGHHDDYAKALEVRWLCRPCHKTWHRKNGKAING